MESFVLRRFTFVPVQFPGENEEEKQKILNIELFSSLIIANYSEAK